MTNTITPESSAIHRLPVITQSLPNLGGKGQDWTSQSGREIAIGSIPVKALQELFTVDRWSSDNPEGYQRTPTPSRVDSLKRDLDLDRVDLPTAILLNLRDYSPDIHLVRSDYQCELVLRPGDKLHVVDGQHRVESLTTLYKDNPEKMGRLRPALCLFARCRPVRRINRVFCGSTSMPKV